MKPRAALAARAADRLLAAANRAGGRSDLAARESLAERALALAEPGTAQQREALLELAKSFQAAVDAERGRRTLAELFTAAEQAGDELRFQRARLVEIELDIEQDPTATMKAQQAVAEDAGRELERLGDEEGVAWALRLVGNFTAWSGKADEAERVLERALEHAERANSPAQVAEILIWHAWSIWWGPIPAEEGIRQADEIIERAVGNPQLEAVATVMRGSMRGMQGDHDGARADIASGRGRLFDMKHMSSWAGTGMVEADMELLAGNPAAAATVLAASHEWMGGQAATGYIATIVGLRAAAALELGREGRGPGVRRRDGEDGSSRRLRTARPAVVCPSERAGAPW